MSSLADGFMGNLDVAVDPKSDPNAPARTRTDASDDHPDPFGFPPPTEISDAHWDPFEFNPFPSQLGLEDEESPTEADESWPYGEVSRTDTSAAHQLGGFHPSYPSQWPYGEVSPTEGVGAGLDPSMFDDAEATDWFAV
jgi:hypothetical protein